MNIIQDGQNEKLPKGKGFYITLAICCISVVAAGWSTYRSVKEFSGTSQSESQDSPAKFKQEDTNNIKAENVSNKNSVAKEKRAKSKNHKKASDATSNKILANEEVSDNDVQSVLSDTVENLIVYPTNNNVIKEFSDGKLVYSKTLGDWRIHDGVDFKAERGSIVKSITGGTVKDIYNDPSYGMTIVIEHDLGFVAYYSGLGDTTLVQKGDKVKSGDDIGSINDVPVEISEEPHLHFMINKEGKFIDPILILDKEIE